MSSRLKNWWKRLFPPLLPHKRLSGTLLAYRVELEKRIQATQSEEAPWARQARELLSKAAEELGNNNIDEGWKCFHAAQRMEIYGLSPEDLYIKAEILKQEASKLNEWRKKAVYALIGSPESPKTTPMSYEQVYHVLLLRDEYYHNIYYKNSLLTKQFSTLFLILFIIILLCFAYFIFWENNPLLKNSELLLHLTGVLSFGLLGATTSTILYVRDSYVQSRIPEIIGSSPVTWSRIFVGAGFSLFIYLLLQTTIVDKIELFSFDIGNLSHTDYLVIAFISGFSERLVLRAITSIVGKEE